jgi:hypothetical protein
MGGNVLIDRLARAAVRPVLKHQRKPWLKDQGCLPPQAHAEFVWAREEVLY